MKCIGILLFCIISFSSASQSRIIKSITTTTYFAVYKGDKLVPFSETNRTTENFDSSGNLICRITYDKERISNSNYFYYDGMNQIVKEREFNEFQTTINKTKIYKYDSLNNLILIIDSVNNSILKSFLYIIDSNHILKMYIDSNSIHNDSIVETIENNLVKAVLKFRLNDLGKRYLSFEKKCEFVDHKLLSQNVKYKLVESNEFKIDPGFSYTCEYDNNGNLVRVIHLSGEIYKYSYQFDKKGNWREQKIESESRKYNEIRKRKIDYH